MEEPYKSSKTALLVFTYALFIVSLFQPAFHTYHEVGGFYCFLFGWLGLNGAGISWLANPLLLSCPIFLMRKPVVAAIISLIAALFALSFMLFDTAVDSESGAQNEITGYGIGYYLWVMDCLIFFFGSLFFAFSQYRKNKANPL